MNGLERFKKGQRVHLSENVLHPEFRDLKGFVEKTVKCRGVVVVQLDSGKRYDAFPQNVIMEGS